MVTIETRNEEEAEAREGLSGLPDDGERPPAEPPQWVLFEDYINIPLEQRVRDLRNGTGPRLAPPNPFSTYPREEIYAIMGPSELPFEEWKRRFDALPRLDSGPTLPADVLSRESIYEA